MRSQKLSGALARLGSLSLIPQLVSISIVVDGFIAVAEIDEVVAPPSGWAASEQLAKRYLLCLALGRRGGQLLLGFGVVLRR